MNAATHPSVADLRVRLAEGTTTASHLAETACAAAEAAPGVFITVDRDGARRSAAEADTRHHSGHPRGELDGIPVAVKDVIDTAGLRTTMASLQFKDNIPPENAKVVQQLHAAGATIIGKANCHEVSLGIRGDAGAFGVVGNPHDPSRVAGGSSSGSAAAVARGIVPVAVGTDTAGSVRVPAALCGVTGFKATYGLIETQGIYPLAPSFDTIGYFGTTVQDIQATLRATGILPQATSVDGTSDELDENDLASIRFAGLEDLRTVVTDPAVGLPYDAVMAHLSAEKWMLPTVDGAAVNFGGIYAVIRSYEAYQVHRELLATAPEKYQRPTLEKLLAGAHITDDQVWVATELAVRSRQVFLEACDHTDILISPTVPALAPPLEGSQQVPAEQLMSLCVPWNVLGWPALSLPYRVPGVSLPQSVQLIGKPGKDALVLRAGELVARLIEDIQGTSHLQDVDGPRQHPVEHHHNKLGTEVRA
jgi:aspartyl-tRNA(Asn)/glutamyl-tRNA(Gln) amidotransferase subunit A